MHLMNNDKSLDKQIDAAENQRLRGDRVRQIAKDMKEFEGTDKEKLLAYSSHLSWCLKTFERIYKLQQMTGQAAKKSLYSHGMANGVIGAMATIMEEQGDVPYIKTPEKYENSEQQFTHQAVAEYIYRLEDLLGKIMLMEEAGPEGYGDEENPILAWIMDVMHLQKNSPVQTEKLKAFRKNLNYEIRKRIENKPE